MIFKNFNMPSAQVQLPWSGDNTPAQIPFGIRVSLRNSSNSHPIMLSFSCVKLQATSGLLSYFSKYDASILKILLKVGSNIFTSAVGFPPCFTIAITSVGSPHTVSYQTSDGSSQQFRDILAPQANIHWLCCSHPAFITYIVSLTNTDSAILGTLVGERAITLTISQERCLVVRMRP